MANSGLPCLPELSGLGDFTDSEMSAHAKRLVRKHAFLYVNTPFGLSLWRREVFKLFFEWQLLSYCIIFKDSFDRFNKWVAYDTLLKSLIKHNAVKTISSPFLITHFPWCLLHQFFHCTRIWAYRFAYCQFHKFYISIIAMNVFSHFISSSDEASTSAGW